MSDFSKPVVVGGSGAPSGPAGGDLSGTYPNPTVSMVDGHTLSVRCIEVTITDADFSSTVDSSTMIEAGARVISCQLSIEAGNEFADNVDIDVGTITSAVDLFMSNTNNRPDIAATYAVNQYTAVAVAESVRVTVGAGAAGAASGKVCVMYVVPEA